MPPFSTTTINLNPNAAVGVADFCLIQSPPFAMPALRYNLGNFLVATVILLLFFFIAVFPYKTLEGPRCGMVKIWNFQKESYLLFVGKCELLLMSLADR